MTCKDSLAAPEVKGYADAAALVAALREVYAAARTAPLAGGRTRVFVFAGSRLRVAGDPVRRLTLDDGTAVDLTDPAAADAEADADDGFLLPRSRRQAY